MLAYDFRNMNDTLRMIYELDDLAFSVLGNSKCHDLDALAIFKLIEGKAPIVHQNRSLSLTTTEGMKMDLSGLPEMISINNKELT